MFSFQHHDGMAQPLKITIVGAGIAGAMAARVLREKHDVTILERFGGGHELGAAIVLGPTATKILDQYGFDRKRSGCVVNDGAKTYDQTGKLVAEFDMKPFIRVAGSDPTFQHRADLWDELMRLATTSSEELGIEGNPAKVQWGADVVSVNVETGEVSLADGSKIDSDLVIGKLADSLRGLHHPLTHLEARTASSQQLDHLL